MEFDHIIIRYGELSTKKRNRKSFVDKMKSHIRWAIKDLKHAKVSQILQCLLKSFLCPRKAW